MVPMFAQRCRWSDEKQRIGKNQANAVASAVLCPDFRLAGAGNKFRKTI